jgi:hypothetical protein
VKRACLIAFLLAAGCSTGTNQSVADKVLTDFGIRPKPEGYETPSDTVFQRLDEVGAQELKRLNAANRRGEVKVQQDGLRAQFYKEVKVYEGYYPLEAAAITGGTYSERGFHGYIDYEYRIYQSPRRDSRAEAENEPATVATGEGGRETYRYTFSSGGSWNGAAGERVRK